MKLTIADRLTIGVFYPEKGNFLKLEIAESIKDKLKIDAEEAESINLKMNDTGNGWTWNDNVEPKNFKIDKSELQFLKDQVDAKNNANELTPQIIKLARKIKNTEIK